jgi:Uma2 family endonuclease
MSTAKRFLPSYTVADYLAWQGDWELWDGIPIAMTPSPFGPHSQAVSKLITSLQIAVEESNCHANVLTELDWIISDNTVVRPDIMIVCGEPPSEHLHVVPALVAEVLSPSTQQRDTGAKMELYASLGVMHYLIVDPHNQTCIACQLSDQQVYLQREVARVYEVSICEECTLKIDLERLRT